MTNMELAELATRIASVLERIAAAAQRAGRHPDEITLVAVSKGHGADTVAAAFACGLRVFGENRVEEAGPKARAVATLLGKPIGERSETSRPEWHMVGHLQSRKAASVLPWARVVHSVDSEKLARRLNQFSAEAGRELPVLLEVNVSGEASKYGFAPQQLLRTVEDILALPALRVQGLMTMAPIMEQPEDVRPVFAGLRELRRELASRYPATEWSHLSMGMTDDFEVAIEEGATMVRIGRAIFGDICFRDAAL
jgi:PLP dependent protein